MRRNLTLNPFVYIFAAWVVLTGTVFLWPQTLSYSNDPFPVNPIDIDPHIGQSIRLEMIRCYTPMPLEYLPTQYDLRVIIVSDTNSLRQNLTSPGSFISPGCQAIHLGISLVECACDLLVGSYHLEGLSTVLGRWRHDVVYWRSQSFNIIQ